MCAQYLRDDGLPFGIGSMLELDLSNMIAHVKMLIVLQGWRTNAERRDDNALKETRHQRQLRIDVLPALLERDYAFECTDRRDIERRARLLEIEEKCICKGKTFIDLSI